MNTCTLTFIVASYITVKSWKDAQKAQQQKTEANYWFSHIMECYMALRELLIYIPTWVNSRNDELSKSHTQKRTYYMVLFIWNFKGDKTNLQWQKLDQWLPGTEGEAILQRGKRELSVGLECSRYWRRLDLTRALHLSSFRSFIFKIHALYRSILFPKQVDKKHFKSQLVYSDRKVNGGRARVGESKRYHSIKLCKRVYFIGYKLYLNKTDLKPSKKKTPRFKYYMTETYVIHMHKSQRMLSNKNKLRPLEWLL